MLLNLKTFAMTSNTRIIPFMTLSQKQTDDTVLTSTTNELDFGFGPGEPQVETTPVETTPVETTPVETSEHRAEGWTKVKRKKKRNKTPSEKKETSRRVYPTKSHTNTPFPRTTKEHLFAEDTTINFRRNVVSRVLKEYLKNKNQVNDIAFVLKVGLKLTDGNCVFKVGQWQPGTPRSAAILAIAALQEIQDDIVNRAIANTTKKDKSRKKKRDYNSFERKTTRPTQNVIDLSCDTMIEMQKRKEDEKKAKRKERKEKNKKKDVKRTSFFCED